MTGIYNIEYLIELLVKMIKVEDQVSLLNNKQFAQEEEEDAVKQSETKKKDSPSQFCNFEWMLTNLNDQMTQMAQVMASMSQELTTVSNRQLKLEETLLLREKREKSSCRNHTNKKVNTQEKKCVPTPLPSQTLGSLPNNNGETVYGPMTRARSKKLRKEIETRTEMQLVGKSSKRNLPRNLGRYNRTLIPWEDIHWDTPHQEEVIKEESDYPSEI